MYIGEEANETRRIYDGGSSDSDSDLEDLQGEIAKLDESVRSFLATHKGTTDALSTPNESSVTRGGSRGRVRGPRKAAKPRGDIYARLAKVNKLVVTGNFQQALDEVSEVIRINAETHQGWTALATIFNEIGEPDKSLSAMVYAAHLRPMDISGWLQCASFALDILEDEDDEHLQTARLCYSAALRADRRNLDARLGKAEVCHRQGHMAEAIKEYANVLKHRPYALDVVRKLAEASIDNRQTEAGVNMAISAYQEYFAIRRRSEEGPDASLWHDVGIYAELFAANARYLEAITEIKSLSRFLVGRKDEDYWDKWQEDDREWDRDATRRSMVSEYTVSPSAYSLHGDALPRDLRARLAMFRLGLGHDEEAFNHLTWLDPTEHHTRDFVSDFPFLIHDLATELSRYHHPATAAKYLEVLRETIDEPDAAVLLHLGQCYLASGQQPAAEECFLSALDIDPDGIEPRIELANMYEKAKEAEEALILAAEAMALRGAQQGATEAVHGRGSHRRLQPRSRGHGSAGSALRSQGGSRSLIPKRYRPKRLGAPDQRRRDEKAHAVKLSRQYETVRDLKLQIQDGRHDLIDQWMQSSQELVDDFRSLKQFYSWDKYLQFLGSKSSFQESIQGLPGNELFLMYERLTRTLIPRPDQLGPARNVENHDDHQGISFDEWLDLFLDYAIGLAIVHRRDEAYQVCEAARDSTVFQSGASNFRIHVAWSVCAIYASDEEKAVTIARHLMKDGVMSDSYRMFALLSNLCQSPITWYTSGPAQKFILRQIRSIDTAQMAKLRDPTTSSNNMNINNVDGSETGLDSCLLMLYGHILFTSTSYTFALSYFLRARALDNANPMVSLSLGLAYSHYALKRQSVNRQYLILQGLTFMSEYIKASQENHDGLTLSEAHYNIGRLFHQLGIPSLAMIFYSQVPCGVTGSGGQEDINMMGAANCVMSLLTLGSQDEALMILKQRLNI